MQNEWLVLIAAAMWPIGIGLIFLERYRTRKGIGARTIQLAVVIMAFPTILILGLERILDSATIGTLMGGVFGYVLSGVGEYLPPRKTGTDADA